MRKFRLILPVLACLSGTLAFALSIDAAPRKSPGRHWVRTYTRKDGTVVQGHWAGSGATLNDSSSSATFNFQEAPPQTPQQPTVYFDRYPQQLTQKEQSWVRHQRLERQLTSAPYVDESGQWVNASPAAPQSAPIAYSGQCVGVTDGDTLKVLHNGKAEVIRLIAIDAPEKAQPFGEVSKQSLSKIAFGKNLTVYPSARDRYGRTLAWVFNGKTGLNAAQIESGLAWWYRQYSPKESKIGNLEAAARTAKVGLWRDPAPVAPWAFRKAKKK